MSPRTAVFIINPRSGVASKEDLPRLIRKYVDPSVFTATISVTEYAGHASVLAAAARDRGVDVVVAVGGDGTVNEVARAIVHSNTALGIIPCGSGNGLARHLLLPMNVRNSIRMLNACEIHALDYGTIDGHPFFCTCGVGFDAIVSARFATSLRRGAISYVENIVQEALNYRPETYTLTANGTTMQHEALLISCANASQYGNNAYIAPQASMSDGMLDVIIIKPLDLIEASQVSIEIFNKTLHQNERIETFRTKALTIHRVAPGVIHYDGDPAYAGTDVDIAICERGINVIVNPTGDRTSRLPNAIQSATAELFNTLNALRREAQNYIKQTTAIPPKKTDNNQ